MPPADAFHHHRLAQSRRSRMLGIASAHEWRRVGVEITALGAAPTNRIHPRYGVFSPVRGEYAQLVATDQDPRALACARDNLAQFAA